ncbi:MAG TPA: hypothetical protein VET65_11270, partial [Candidatus Limnocylindrales bacterium]|nr:hypothetical protein [Candidatus Limnocylindrales bacterium]
LAARVRGRRDGWPVAPAALLGGGSGVLFALGAGSKLSGLIVAAPIMVVVELGARGSRWRIAGAFGVGAAAATAVILIPAVGHWSAAYSQLVTLHLNAGAQSHRGVANNWQLILYQPERALEMLAVVLAAVAVVGPVRAVLVPVAWGIAAVGATLVYQPLFLHHVVFVIPALALVAGVGVHALARRRVPTVAVRVQLPAFAFGAIAVAVFVAVGAFQVGHRQAQQAIRAGAHNAAIASVIRSETATGAYVISDNQFAVALANRDVPPSLVDTSGAQILDQLMTTDAVERAARRYQVPLVVLDSGRLKRVPGLLAWLKSHYPAAESVGETTIFEVKS